MIGTAPSGSAVAAGAETGRAGPRAPAAGRRDHAMVPGAPAARQRREYQHDLPARRNAAARLCGRLRRRSGPDRPEAVRLRPLLAPDCRASSGYTGAAVLEQRPVRGMPSGRNPASPVSAARPRGDGATMGNETGRYIVWTPCNTMRTTDPRVDTTRRVNDNSRRNCAPPSGATTHGTSWSPGQPSTREREGGRRCRRDARPGATD